MNVYVITNGINSLFSLTIALIIFINKSRKPLHLTYALFSLSVFAWAFTYLLWGLQTNQDSAIFWLRILLCSVCFTHMFYFHFVLKFSNNVRLYKRYLIVGYLFSFCLLLINLNNGFYDLSYPRMKPPFLYWPHASPLLSLIIIAEICYLLLSFYILGTSIKKADEPIKTRLRLFLIANIIGWAGGLTNWFYFYDSIPIPPLGNSMVTFYLIATSYLIFKHDILDLNLVIKRTFLYALLTLFITLTYILFIIVSERLFQSFFGYSSIIATLLAAVTIALLFNPLRSFLIKFMDKAFYGKNIEELSTENVQMKSELQKQDRLKAVATLASGMAHEIKNPLTAIKTFTEYLPNKSHDPDFISKFKKVVGPEVEKIDTIVKQLLEFSKPSPLKPEKLDIHQTIEETLELLNGELVKHKIRIEKQLQPFPIVINGDKKQLKQVFLNIFLNSIQAMPNGGTLTISTTTNQNHSSVSIRDTGYGISEEHISHIFDPFFTTKKDGTGLGLSIVHGIIKEHGGNVEVSSTVNRGTEFKLALKSL